MGTLKDWTAYNALNTNKTLIDKAKTFCLWFFNNILLFKKDNPLVSALAVLIVKFIIIIISKCLDQRVFNNFIITKKVYYFLSSGKQEEKS